MNVSYFDWGKSCEKNYSSVRRCVANPVNVSPNGFILDDLHDNEEDVQHIDDGKQNRRMRRVSDHKQLSDHQSEATRRTTFKRKEERNGTLCYWLMLAPDAATQRLKKKGMPLPPWRRADYVKAKRWVVEVMATAHGYTIDDAIYRLTKLLRTSIKMAMEIDKILTIVFVLSGKISYWIIRLGIII
nr:hypothetical protein [Tanacetum cinerariifolium]